MKPSSRSALISDTIPNLYQLSFELNEPYYNFGSHIRSLVRGVRAHPLFHDMQSLEDLAMFFMIADELAMATENSS